jgi:hypothetical protein
MIRMVASARKRIREQPQEEEKMSISNRKPTEDGTNHGIYVKNMYNT